MQAMVANRKACARIRAYIDTKSEATQPPASEHSSLQSVEARVARAGHKHFGIGEEEIFAVTDRSMIFAAKNVITFTFALTREKTKPGMLRTRKGETLLHIYVQQNRIEILEYLMEKKHEHDTNVNDADNLGRTALHLAAAQDLASIARLLILHGASLTCRDRAGQTPAHYAAGTNSLKALHALYESQSVPRTPAVLSLLNRSRATPAHVAMALGHVDAVRFLFTVGCDLCELDSQFETAGHKAGRNARLDSLCALEDENLLPSAMRQAADLEALTMEGDTAWHLAHDDFRYG